MPAWECCIERPAPLAQQLTGPGQCWLVAKAVHPYLTFALALALAFNYMLTSCSALLKGSFSGGPLVAAKHALHASIETGQRVPLTCHGRLIIAAACSAVGASFSLGTLERDEVALARETARVLSQLGPTFVKLGQLLSSRQDLMSPAVAAELGRLQSNVAPFSDAAALKVIRHATAPLGSAPAIRSAVLLKADGPCTPSISREPC